MTSREPSGAFKGQLCDLAPPTGIPAASLVLFIVVVFKAKGEKWFRQFEGKVGWGEWEKE